MTIEVGQSRDLTLTSSFLEDFLTSESVITNDHIEIHTSDRTLFKRCRRKWNWQSGLRENLIPIGQSAAALWFGTGWHFLLEDYFGYRRFPSVDHAIVAYKEAFRPHELPPDVRGLMDTMAGMAHYFTEDWLKYHPEPYQTLWVNGVPQVEVDCDVDITEKLISRAGERFGPEYADWFIANTLKGVGGNPILRVIYRMTFDRVGIDADGFLYIIDYKTARQIDTNKLSNDPQVEAYYWGGSQFYGDKLIGIAWQQFFKGFPDEPEWLVSSNRFSMNKQQRTTYPLYRKALKEKYGSIPPMYHDFLSHLGDMQTAEGDQFIRTDILRRNPHSRRAAEAKILDEVLDMLDPSLPLYPNPTRDCSWDCPYKDACIAMDDGSDVEFLLESSFERWRGYKQDWKTRVKFPGDE